jgi:phenol 2-monooxygenase
LEGVLLDDLLERDLEVHRNITFVDYTLPDDPSNLKNPIEIMCESDVTREKLKYQARYLVGADGAMSNVRRLMPGARQTGSSSGEIWGVIDGTLETDFPDIYSKTVVHSQEAGTIVILPRERNMTRVYVELRSDYLEESAMKSQSSVELTQMYVMDQIAEILEPYSIKWKKIEWFGRYQISRKLASKFIDSDQHPRVFLVGDAAHTHSPKSQGMNSGIHDACNLAWKLNLCVRNLCKSSLVASYDNERRQVAEDLVDYDTEQLEALTGGDSEAFAENVIRNARIVSGFGADYTPSILNVSQKGSILGQLRVGSIPPPGKVTRFFDMNPVDIQLDIPMLGQFRIYLFTRTIDSSSEFLDQLSQFALDQTTSLGRALTSANHSYSVQPPIAATSDEFIRPERYTTISGLVTFSLVLRSMDFDEIDLMDLPPLFRESKDTIYLDDVPHLDTKGMTCSEKWLGSVAGSEVDVVVVRPDGYVGTIYRGLGSREHAKRACKHLTGYFEGFLSV